MFTIPSSQKCIRVNQPQLYLYGPSLMGALCLPSIPVHGALQKNYHAIALPQAFFDLHTRAKFKNKQKRHG